MLRFVTILTPSMLVGCSALVSDPDVQEDIQTSPPRAAWTPPTDWTSMPAQDFEALLLSELPDGTQTPLDEAVLNELALALDRQDESSVRAAVILARASTVEAGNRLFRRLTKREASAERHGDAGDVVAAAAIGCMPSPERWWRIVRLVNGKNPHPDLEVRVECACTALALGHDQVIPFLLEVLRIGTWEGQADELDFTPPERTAWARGRAAEALSARAGVPLTYPADGPIVKREREARRLEDLLADAIAAAVE